MRRIILFLFPIATILACYHAGGEESPLTSVGQIRHLSQEESNRGIGVVLRGVVTYYEPAEHILFVEDQTGPIFVDTTGDFPIRKGNLVEVRGVTEDRTYHSDVSSNDIRAVGIRALPAPHPATFPELMNGTWDCSYVTITGTIRSATIQQTPGEPFLLMEVLMAGGYVNVHVEQPGNLDPRSLLDAKVTLTGVSGGAFDGKFQVVGANLYLDSPSGMRIDAKPSANLEKLPLTAMDSVMAGYYISESSKRVRVRGSVTLYEPGTRLVLENQGQAILVHTHERAPLALGEVVDATGFPSASDYSQSLQHGEFLRTSASQVIQPKPVRWQDALTGHYAFNLISIEGQLVEQVHERQQDTLVVDSGGHVFSAMFRHAPLVGSAPAPEMPEFPIGSRVRVAGVCFVEAGGPWNSALWFELHMRTPEDVSVLVFPSWWTVRRLIYLIVGLWAVIVTALIWGAVMRRRVQEQTQALRRTMEEDAARERHQAFLEKQRSRVLEAINSSMPLDQVLGMITDFISEQLQDACCWCELTGGHTVGCKATVQGDAAEAREFRRDILSSTGDRLGAIILVLGDSSAGDPSEVGVSAEVLDIGASLAALAIDNRRLYEGLIHRSQYDQLTEVPNRFLLGSKTKEAIDLARQHERQMALIYIDLDRFKDVNDRYGHRVGDVYLQHAARRLTDRLRSHDMLARVGGDEFIALISIVRDRTEADEIARRLARCFDSPFRVDGYTIHGTASIGIAVYPEDGMDEDQLKRVADAAMYAAKQRMIFDP